MPGPILHAATVATCPHGGVLTIVAASPRVVMNGMPAAVLTDQGMVAGCAFTVPPSKPQPCVTTRWIAAATRVLAGGVPVLINPCTALCQSAEQIPRRTAGHLGLTDAGGGDMTRLAFPYGPAASGRSATVLYGSDAHVRQMLELLIFTLTGERVMRPDLGSPVGQMVFGAGNGPAAIALEATLEATITQWLGHVLELHDLTVAFDEADASLEVVVTYETLLTRTGGRVAVRKDLT